MCCCCIFALNALAFSHDLGRYLNTNYKKSRRVIIYSNFAVFFILATRESFANNITKMVITTEPEVQFS